MSRPLQLPASEESQLLNAELENFETDCTTGNLALSSRILNFEKSRFLKRRTKPSEKFANPESTTREAFLVDVIDLDLPPHERRIFDAMPNHGRSAFRVKIIKYGNHNAMWEVMSSQLYALTGMRAPDNRLMKISNVDERGIPQLCVASPIIAAYQDLGDFLIGAAARFIERENASEWQKQKAIIEEINLKGKEGRVTPKDKLERIKAMEAIYKMLPAYFHNEIQKAFAASKFIANWDFANFNLANIGCKFLLDSDGNVVKLESVFVDFGNSGVIGFGGKYKELSHERANLEAKPYRQAASDYDPRLSLSEKEKEFLLSKAKEVTEVNSFEELEKNWALFRKTLSSLAQQVLSAGLEDDKAKIAKSILFKDSHHILKEETDMELSRFSGILTVADLPRNLPFAFLLRDSVRQKDDNFFTAGKYSYCDSEVEMAFRLSLIPDKAINYVIRKWNLCESYPHIFAMPQGLDPQHDYSTAGLIKIFQQRKRDLIETIPAEVVKDWVLRNKAKAISAQMDVELAIEQRVGPGIFQGSQLIADGFKESRDREDLSHVKFSLTAEIIKNEIKNFEEQMQSSPYVRQKREELAKIIEENSKLPPSVSRFLQEVITQKDEELQYELMQMKVNHLQRSITKWHSNFDFDPSFNPFDLHKIRKIYQASHPNHKESADGKYVSSTDNHKKNQAIYEENSFIYGKFMSILDKLILSPSKMVKKPSDSAIAMALVPKSESLEKH